MLAVFGVFAALMRQLCRQIGDRVRCVEICLAPAMAGTIELNIVSLDAVAAGE